MAHVLLHAPSRVKETWLSKNMANILIRFSNAFEKNWSFDQGHGSSGVGGKVQMLNAMS